MKIFHMAVLIVLLMIVQGCGEGIINQELDAQKPFIDGEVQQAGDSIVVKKAYLDKPGYVVLFLMDYGKQGGIAGVSELFDGEKSDFIISLKNVEEGEHSIMVRLYYDNGDSIFDPSKGDMPADVQNELQKASCTPAPVSSC